MRPSNGRAAFLALRAKIQADITAGHFKKTIHLNYEKELGISYRQFLRYVTVYDLDAELRALLPGGERRTPAPAIVPSRSLPQSSSQRSQKEPIRIEPAAPRRFIFDPTNIDESKLF